MLVPKLMLRLAARQMNTPSATSPPLCVAGAGGEAGEGGGCDAIRHDRAKAACAATPRFKRHAQLRTTL